MSTTTAEIRPATSGGTTSWRGGGGVILFPILLPWLPTRVFSGRGFVLCALVALPFALAAALGSGSLWRRRTCWRCRR